MDLRELRVALLGIVVCTACTDSPPGRTYFDRNIKPILMASCAGNTSKCHATDDGDIHQFAAGNLDVTSFAAIQKRRDVLTTFGPYPKPLLLVKAVAPAIPDPTNTDALTFQYYDKFLPIEVTHVGGAVLKPNSEAFYTLQTWLQNGATEDGVKPASPPKQGTGTCSTAVPAGFDITPYMMLPKFASAYDKFKQTVQPVLTKHGCSLGSCHGAPQSDFYITCGDDETQTQFNFTQAWSFVNNPVDDSQILRVPLAVAAGGRGHTGGDQFASTSDPDFVALQTWATDAGVLDFAGTDPRKQFFKDHVQPILIARGCSFQACHSPQATNDFKLRSGTQGFYSAVALQKNYDLLKGEFMALEFPDARRSRAVAKTITDGDPAIPNDVTGIDHRARGVLETPMRPGDPGPNHSDPAQCPPWSATANPPPTPFCTIQEWVRLERAALTADVSPMDPGDPARIVFVERTTANAGRLEFDTFAGNADLKVVQTTYGPAQALNPVDAGGATSLLAGCAGVTPGTVDVQAPDVANDGTRVAFAMRRNANEPLTIWTVNIDGTNCQQVMPAQPDSNGIKVHDFDPAWSPDGKWIVFASTRGKSGAMLSRKRFLPQSDLWRIELATNKVEQMTFLSNSEISPAFMREGRVIMTTEKVSDGFYQLSGRRINWDLTDYHPLLAQRAMSPYVDPDHLDDLTTMKPSVGYPAATDIREGNDGNFILILSDVGPDGKAVLPGGAGRLVTFNRSIGPFEEGRTEPGYLQSMKAVGEAQQATGKAGATVGYRAPFYLPDGKIMVSRTTNLTTPNWEIYTVNPRTNAVAQLVTGGAGKVRVDAVLAYKFPVRPFYLNRRQLVFGGSSATDDPTHAVVHMPDAPMLFTLLTGNLRHGRPLAAFSKAKYLTVWSEGTCGASCQPNTNGIFESRQKLATVPLAEDGSVKIEVPSGRGYVFELEDGNHASVVKMTEEHQLGPGEHISMGVSRTLFDAVCGGCHGSISGHELDIRVTPDALTGASQSLSATVNPTAIGN